MIAFKLIVLSMVAFSACNDNYEKNVPESATEAVDSSSAQANEPYCEPFPSPLPKSSAKADLRRSYLVHDTVPRTVGGILDSVLLPALEKADYEPHFFCGKKSEVVLLTQLEEIDDKGVSKRKLPSSGAKSFKELS